jgi:hypothetical protein
MGPRADNGTRRRQQSVFVNPHTLTRRRGDVKIRTSIPAPAAGRAAGQAGGASGEVLKNEIDFVG